MKNLHHTIIIALLFFSQALCAQWIQQCPAFKGSGANGSYRFGSAVSISGDGQTAAATYINNKGIYSGVITYKWQGGQWALQQNLIIHPTNYASPGNVKLSYDGKTLAYSGGAYKDTLFIYAYIAGSWNKQASFLITNSSVSVSHAVSVAYNGNTIVARNRVYVRQGNNWQLQQVLLPADKPVPSAYFCDSANKFSCVANNAISADGNTVVISDLYAPDTSTNAWVFTRTGTIWAQQGNRLEGIGNSGFTANSGPAGVSVSGDGKTLIIGNNGTVSSKKGVWAFALVNGIWVEQGNGPLNNPFQTNIPPAYTGTDDISGGESVLSYDGNTLLSGGNSMVGFVHWKRINGNWSLVDTINSPNATSYYDIMALKSSGGVVAIDSSGTRAVWGMSNYKGFLGVGGVAGFVFTGGHWSQQGPLFSIQSLSDASQQGRTIAMSRDGSSMAAAAFKEQGDFGAVWVFKRNGADWNQVGQKLTLSAWQPAYFGAGLGFSANGNILAVGVQELNSTSFGNATGGVYVYVYNGNSYVLRDSIIMSGADSYGDQVSLSDDGNTMLVLPWSGSAPALVYFYSGGRWNLQATLPGIAYIGGALSGDGNTAAVCDAVTNNEKGYLNVFKRTGTTWALEFGPVQPAGLQQYAHFANALDISQNGNKIAAGCSGCGSKGQLYVYTRTGGSWGTTPDTVAYNVQAQLGGNVAISSAGDIMAATSAFYVNPRLGIYTYNGSAWVFNPAVPIADDMSTFQGLNTDDLAASGDMKYIGAGYINDVDAANGDVRVFIRTSLRDTVLQLKSATCTQVTNGKIKIKITGGTLPYTYRWSNGTTGTDSVINLAPGQYRVTISDATGDSLIRQYTVKSQYNLMAANYTTAFVCSTGTGSISISASGGISPYSYSWNVTPPQNTATAVQLNPGTYIVTITDAGGCATTDTAELTSTNTLWGNLTVTHAICSTPGYAAVTLYGGTPPYTYNWSNGATTAIDSQLVAGTYTTTVTDATGCSFTGTAVVNANCNFSIEGRVFYDKNNDCMQQAGELPARYYTMLATDGTTTVFGNTDSLGDYNITTPFAGTYTVSIAQAQQCSYPLCSDSVPPVTATVTTTIPNVTGVNFPLVNAGIDLTMQVNTLPPFPGSTFNYTIYYGNLQDSIVPTGSLSLTYDGALFVNSTTPAATTLDTINHIITWNLTNIGLLFPLGTQQVSINYTLRASTLPQTTIVFRSTILPTTGDCNPVNNTLVFPMLILGSLDPNYKAAYPANTLAPDDSVIIYTIHFQNTGTASTHFIEILDTLQPSINPATVTTIATSHQPYVFKIKDTGILSWKFDPISLPDSASDPIGSQGYITYRAIIKPNLPLGTLVTNRASIYFDYNTPILTNTASNVIEQPAAIAQLAASTQFMFRVFPNPAGNYTNVNADAIALGGTLQLTDITGRVVAHQIITTTLFQLNTGSLPSGIYFARLTCTNGQQAVQKLIISR